MDVEQFFLLIGKYGIPTVITGISFWFGLKWIVETRGEQKIDKRVMTDRINELEEGRRTDLVESLNNSYKAMDKVSDSVQALATSIATSHNDMKQVLTVNGQHMIKVLGRIEQLPCVYKAGDPRVVRLETGNGKDSDDKASDV